MINPQRSSSLVIGLALFSMFFGAGNLIFPMAVGTFSQSGYLAGTAGFILTAVFLPFVGVLTMVLFSGDYERFFAILGKKGGFLFAFCLLLFWIPLGSGPRCITLAYSGMQKQLGSIFPLWAFSLVYSALVYWMALRPSRAIQILGKILTPLLLGSLSVIFVSGLYYAPSAASLSHDSLILFFHGIAEGYNTQDLIASFFFSSSIISILCQFPAAKADKQAPIRLALRSSVIGMTILAAVYLGLLYLGAIHADILAPVSKDALLPTLALHLLGGPLAWIAISAVALACLTTSVALALVFTDFVQARLLKVSYSAALGLTTVVTFGMSTIGFDGIASILSPAMQVLYPALIALIVLQLGGALLQDVSRRMQKDP